MWKKFSTHPSPSLRFAFSDPSDEKEEEERQNFVLDGRSFFVTFSSFVLWKVIDDIERRSQAKSMDGLLAPLAQLYFYQGKGEWG